MTDEDVTLGEVWRAVRRLELSVSQMTAALSPIAEFRVNLQNAKQDIDELGAAVRENKSRLDSIELRAAGVAGGATALVLIGKFLLGK